jgi:DNA-binding transcriptional regulator YhcF (GntR family)
MADWQTIKNEYLTATQKPSYRKLAEKYGLNKDTIWRKAKDEDWDDQRRQHIDKTQTKILMSDIKQKVSSAEKLNEATEMLLGNVIALMRSREPEEMDTQEMKHISGVLKDCKEILMIKSQKDLEEQDARIAKLRREAEKEENQSRDVTITIAGGDPSWQS